MSPYNVIESAAIGAQDWREAADEVLARAREVSRHANELVRASLGDEVASGGQSATPAQSHEPEN